MANLFILGIQSDYFLAVVNQLLFNCYTGTSHDDYKSRRIHRNDFIALLNFNRCQIRLDSQ